MRQNHVAGERMSSITMPAADLDLAPTATAASRLFRMLVKVDLLVLDDWELDRLSTI
jgi:hypothetical protein